MDNTVAPTRQTHRRLHQRLAAVCVAGLASGLLMLAGAGTALAQPPLGNCEGPPGPLGTTVTISVFDVDLCVEA
ncbi:hypothetical protein M8C13_32290 [Crossiella sp. SN42]|uniref:hypothetical protein n=1 Tax=Crossiella sp. SN42 TaxID=2944808 RepID=UPI00207C75F8|nr:hypothetical protein [Crossiella sp. SN42]MCO1580445.1 hypothetical protein [Crossiella sp. SN42]